MLSLRYICQLQICPFTCCLFCQLSLGTRYIQGDLFSSETSRIHEFELQKYFCIQIVCKVSNPRKIKLGQHVQMFNLFTRVLRVKIWHYHFQFCAKCNFHMPKHWHVFGEVAVFFVASTLFLASDVSLEKCGKELFF